MPDTPDPIGSTTVLAFDFGLRRIGLAVGQDVTGSASPLGVIRNSESGVDYQAIARHIADWRPTRLVVGRPLGADGSESDILRAATSFAAELGRYGLPVDMVDERYTSLDAKAALKRARAAGTRGRIGRADIDAAAAVLIAERYLESRS